MSKNKPAAERIVGIGASAGGLEAIQAVVANLPRSLDGIAIIIAQHLSPDYKSMLVELLGRKTSLPVAHIENGMQPTGGTIYIAPPSDDIALKKRAFYLKKPASVGAHPSIDVLFNSLAKEYGTKSAGVVLSGTGKDGSRGLLAIQQAGGVTIVQDPSSAKYRGMPDAAVAIGQIAYVLTPENIGKRLYEIMRGSPRPVGPPEQTEPLETFPQIFNLLERRIGIDFSDYKLSTLTRRLDKRIRERHFANEDEYLAYIRKHPEELDRLFEAVLIGVTSFYRDPEAFEELRAVVKKLLTAKKPGDPLRIWVPGCATGEEAYTLAAIVCDTAAAAKSRANVQIFATDIDMKALQKARAGQYPAAAVKNVPPKMLGRYFKKLNDQTYEVHKDVRKLVLFSRHDVTANPPFLRLDLITCRNLLIYFNTDLQKKVLPLFYYALNPKGYLMLGKSENIGKHSSLFTTVNVTYKLFQRRASDGAAVKFPRMLPRRVERAVPASYLQSEDMSVTEMVKETLYKNNDAPFLVVDDNLDIIEIQGDVTPYLSFRQGGASLNISRLIVQPLQIELRTVTTKVLQEMKPVHGSIRRLGGRDKPLYMRLSVRPLLYSQPTAPYFLVMFETVEVDGKLMRMGEEVVEGQDSPRVAELEHELDATKEHLSSLLEELETSNEELQALNEEMQASNEELQASNEELETSNEELQATNEELENAYSELREAANQIERQKSQLERAAENLSTLINSTIVGFILIDRDYRVMSSNKIARSICRELFAATMTEGRSFIKYLPPHRFDSFLSDFKKALGGRQVLREVAIEDGKGAQRYFDFNYTPVTRSKNEKEARYVAVSFVEITERKIAELELVAAKNSLLEEKHFMHTLTESLPSFIWTTDHTGKFIYCNQHFLHYVGKSLAAFKSLGWKAVIHPDDWPATEAAMHEALETGHKLRIQHRILSGKGDYLWYLTLAEAINGDKNKPHWVGSSSEIDSMKRREEMEKDVERLRQQRNELVHVNKIKDEFISLASHQLRTPATAVKQYLGILMDEYAGPVSADQLQYLQTAYTSNERQLRIINDLLKTAQLDADGYAINKQRHDMSELLQQILEESQPMFDLRRQKATLKTSGVVYARIDHEEMKIALTNLVENASKYSYPQTEIRVTVEEQPDKVCVAIKDQGVGIDPASRKLIFEKFTRIDNDLSDTVSGTGLGLYWVKRIVTMHNGKINIRSTPKKGSTFTIELPK